MVQTTVMWHCAGGCEMGDKGFGVFRAGDGSQSSCVGVLTFLQGLVRLDLRLYLLLGWRRHL